MKTEIKKVDSTKREISIEVSGELVKNKFENVYKKISESAKVKGFRPGHVPRDILEKNYSSLAQEEVLKELIPDVYAQAIQKEGLEAIELPQISEVKLDNNTLSFKASVEVTPEINIRDYRGIRVNSEKITVTAEEIKRSIDSLKESRKAENISDAFARELGYLALTDLEKILDAQIFLHKDNLRRQKIENLIIEHITKGLDFKLPQSLVDKQLEDLVRQAKLDLALKGLSKDEISEREVKLKQDLQAQARNQVRVYLVLAAIAKKENIAQDEHMPRRVMEFLLKEGNWVEAS